MNIILICTNGKKTYELSLQKLGKSVPQESAIFVSNSNGISGIISLNAILVLSAFNLSN
jgi:hypothetical protein